MTDLNSTLAEIERIEKVAGAEVPPATFDAKSVKEYTEAATVFKAALEKVEKAQPEEVQKADAGRAVAVARAVMMNLDGVMSLLFQSNEVDDVVRGQFQNAINLLSPMTKTSAAKNAPADTPAEPATDPETPTPTAKADGESEPSAADQAAVAGKNEPENHEPGNGAPADPENVAWPADMNTKVFREKSTEETPKSTWGSDGEQVPAA